jgi:hypothetical protein
MAGTYTPSWTNATLHSSSTVTNGSSAQDDLNLATLGYYAIDAQVDIDIASGSPSGDVVIEVFKSCDGGTNVNSEASQRCTLSFTATGNKKRGLTITGPWCRVKVTNNTGVSVTYVGRYSGLKQTST